MALTLNHHAESGFFPFPLPRKSWYTEAETGLLTEIPLEVAMQWYWLGKAAELEVNVSSSVNYDFYGDGSDVRYGTSITTGVMPAVATSTPAERCSLAALESGLGSPFPAMGDEGEYFSTETDYTYSGYLLSDPSETYSYGGSDTTSATGFSGWLGLLLSSPYLYSDDSGSFNTLFVPTPGASIALPEIANMSLQVNPDAIAGDSYYTISLSDVIFKIVAPWGTVTIPIYIVTLAGDVTASASGSIIFTLTEVWS